MKTLITATLTIAAAAVSLAINDVAQAAIITPADVTATSSLLPKYPVGQIIDGSGLSGGGTSGDILAETHSTGADGPVWLGAVSDGQVLDFTLPAATDVGAIHIWNYDRNANGNWDKRALASIDLYFSDDNGANYSAAPISITGILGNSDISVPIPAQTFTFAIQSGVTDIRINNIQNHGKTDYHAVAEIRFDTAPEPATMSLLTLGGLALLRRRRRRS